MRSPRRSRQGRGNRIRPERCGRPRSLRPSSGPAALASREGPWPRRSPRRRTASGVAGDVRDVLRKPVEPHADNVSQLSQEVKTWARGRSSNDRPPTHSFAVTAPGRRTSHSLLEGRAGVEEGETDLGCRLLLHRFILASACTRVMVTEPPPTSWTAMVLSLWRSVVRPKTYMDVAALLALVRLNVGS